MEVTVGAGEGEAALLALWEAALALLGPPPYATLGTDPHRLAELEGLLAQLEAAGSLPLFRALFRDGLRQHLHRVVVPEFWARVGQGAATPPEAMATLAAALSFLASACAALRLPTAAVLGPAAAAAGGATFNILRDEGLLPLLRATITTSVPPVFDDMVKDVYYTAFKYHQKLEAAQGGAEMEESEDEDDDAEPFPEEAVMRRSLDQFQQLNRQLYELELLHGLVAQDFVAILHRVIDDHVATACKGEFEERMLAGADPDGSGDQDGDEEDGDGGGARRMLLVWLDRVVLGWLRLVLPAHDRAANELHEGWRARLTYHTYKVLGALRISELFDIIVDFPDSKPAVEDLKECLHQAEQRKLLVSSLSTALQRRLLHPGANTSDIITQYINAIKTLRVLDPSGVMLDLVCNPVREYLQGRTDTVRCIVSSLTNDSSSELFAELAEGKPLMELDDDESDHDNLADADNWMPEPVEELSPQTSKRSRKGDITSMLVNIYGSRELFVEEYRVLLAERLLAAMDFDANSEVRNLELLKLRFGEEHMQVCEVMLKDIADSKRINTNIQQKFVAARGDENIDIKPLSVFVLSRLFWPPFREDTLQLPERIQAVQQQFTQRFEELKAARTLDYKDNLGLVELEIELESRTVEVTVPPVQAAIIVHFEEKKEWTLADLSSQLQITPVALRRRIGYWIGMGLVVETAKDTFLLREDGDDHDADYHMEDDEATADAEDDEPDRTMWWPVIRASLTAKGEADLATLKGGFVMLGISPSDAELRAFLETRDEVQFSNGVYRLGEG